MSRDAYNFILSTPLKADSAARPTRNRRAACRRTPNRPAAVSPWRKIPCLRGILTSAHQIAYDADNYFAHVFTPWAHQQGDAMKVGIIRCMQTEDMCPGSRDFKVIHEKKGAFAGVEGEIEIIGFNACGGCPGKKAVTRAVEMVNRGADTIALASCITRGNPIGFPCPHARIMKAAIAKKTGGFGHAPRLHPLNFARSTLIFAGAFFAAAAHRRARHAGLMRP
jgi:predicted metal-binding protein